MQIKEETDGEMAARLQREFDTMNNGRASRSGGVKTLKRKKVRKSAPEVGSDGEERPRKRRSGNNAFNKELILRWGSSYASDKEADLIPAVVTRCQNWSVKRH